ncbi:MAG TPA: toll/interleukin-1 receptor domain-containing protein [Candidatus Limnocylindrales bacterium]|nr:toll/interleukin-1 receptor domain-containing protein [Candidatus Limnocylindrales bacterium]
MAGRVFISYSRIDRGYVDRLAEFLSGAGISAWYDYEIETGEPFARRIQDEIDRCAVVVPVLTPAAASSPWVLRELGYADELRKPILPLLLATCRAPLVVSGLQHESVVGAVMPSKRFVERLRSNTESDVATGQVGGEPLRHLVTKQVDGFNPGAGRLAVRLARHLGRGRADTSVGASPVATDLAGPPHG